MTRAQAINASKPAVRAAIVALYPTIKGDELNTVTGTVAVYLHDKGYSVTDPWFQSVVDDARDGYESFINQL